jgi:hypothetical protein
MSRARHNERRVIMESLKIRSCVRLAPLLWTADVGAVDQQFPYEGSLECPNPGPTQQIPDTQPSPSKHGNWPDFGGGIYNNRWARSDAVVDINTVGQLQPHCQSNAYSPGVSTPPLVENGIAYYPTWSGPLVALD